MAKEKLSENEQRKKEALQMGFKCAGGCPEYGGICDLSQGKNGAKVFCGRAAGQTGKPWITLDESKTCQNSEQGPVLAHAA